MNWVKPSTIDPWYKWILHWWKQFDGFNIPEHPLGFRLLGFEWEYWPKSTRRTNGRY